METTQDSALASLRDRILDASATATPLRIRGGGSKDFYGQTLQGEVLDTRGLNGVVSYEPSELVVTARAGTPLHELEALLGAHGQHLPFEPPRLGWSAPATAATVGGMVAAGLSGPARASAGSVRDHVLGLTLLNGRAEMMRFGGQVIKNVAGYDVSRVMAGALGCLGLIVDVSLKVMPMAPAEATLAFDLGQADALAQLHRWGGLPLPINASCWVHDEGRGRLFVRLRGAAAAVEAACTRLLGDVPASARPERLDQAQAAADWTLCRDQHLPFFTQPPASGMALWRLSLPQTAPVLDLPWPQLVEWQGAQRWLWAPAAATEALRTAAAQAKGTATIFVANNGVSSAESGKKDAELTIFPPLDRPLERIQRQLKAEFDPSGIFNRGRLYGAW